MYLTVTLSPKEHKRIFKKISIDEKSKCWNWKGALDNQGYGLLWYKKRTERIHRVMYVFFNKAIPRGTSGRVYGQIDHLCRNHSCCNPKHLELVSQRINVLRGEGITAKAAKQITCIYGHPFKQGKKRRWCPTCDRLRVR